MLGVASVFLGGQQPHPLCVTTPILYVVDVQNIMIMIKRVYGLSGCQREGLAFLVPPEFLMDVGSAEGGQIQAR